MTGERYASQYVWTLKLSEINHDRLHALHFLDGHNFRSGVHNIVLDHYLFDYPGDVLPVDLKPFEGTKPLFMRVAGRTAEEINRRAEARQLGPFATAHYILEYGIQDLAANDPDIDTVLAIRKRRAARLGTRNNR
jgi:hypothetical protein